MVQYKKFSTDDTDGMRENLTVQELPLRFIVLFIWIAHAMSEMYFHERFDNFCDFFRCNMFSHALILYQNALIS
jgi:hypothetical protein